MNNVPTPETDAFRALIRDKFNANLVSDKDCVEALFDLTRKLERERDEARRQLDGERKDKRNQIERKREANTHKDEFKAERDQLRKVCDELAHGIEAFRDFGTTKHGTHYDVMMECYKAYTHLPHVQQRNRKV